MIYTLPGVNSNEDKLRSASINKPLTDEHENSRPKIKDSWSKKLTDCLDMFHDHHNETLNIAREGFKGAGLGLFLALSNQMFYRQQVFQGFVLKKVKREINKDYLKIFSVSKSFLLPYILGGFAFGSGYYVISKLVHNEDSSIMSNRLKMNVPFGGVLMATVIHPNLWWLGCLMGLLGTFAFNDIQHGQNGYLRDNNLGYAYQLPGLSEEQIQKQRQRDLIEHLGQNIIFQKVTANL